MIWNFVLELPAQGRLFYFCPADQQHQDFEAELLTPRSMVAVFDYNPKESSPNADVEVTPSCSSSYRLLFPPCFLPSQHTSTLVKTKMMVAW